jgi:hypothetical protein
MQLIFLTGSWCCHGNYFYDIYFILSHIWGCDYRWGMDWILDLLTTCMHHSELHFTDHCHTQATVHSLSQSPLAIFWQRLLRRELPVHSECIMTKFGEDPAVKKSAYLLPKNRRGTPLLIYSFPSMKLSVFQTNKLGMIW